MNATLHRAPGASGPNQRSPKRQRGVPSTSLALRASSRAPDAPTPARPALFAALGWAGLVLVASTLVFCHGCHAGDHDDELSIVCPDDR